MNLITKILALIFAGIMPVTTFTACSEKESYQMNTQRPKECYITTWGAAAMSLGLEFFPTKPVLKGNTLRQTANISLGGDKFTFTFSNEYGTTPLAIEKVYVAKQYEPGDSSIDVNTNTVITFNQGSEGVTIAPGETITSDPVEFSCDALENIAVSMEFGKEVPVKTTGHEFANVSCFVAEGKCGDKAALDVKGIHKCTYYLTRINVWSDKEAGAIVCLGDSITDGVGSDENKFNDYPSVLARLLQSDESTSDLAVVNHGIGGNKFADNSCVGPCGLDRFERDVLRVEGVEYVLLFIGTNDIGAADSSTVKKMTDGYKKAADACHEKGIKIYAATITPIRRSGYDSDLNRQVLDELNTYLRSDTSVFDGVIEFYGAVEDSNNPGTVASQYNCPWGDYLHLGARGYEKLAQTAFEFIKSKISR